MSSTFETQMEKMKSADGFIAALDQSGGSTPKALRLYGIPDDTYKVGERSMFDAVHEMRSRIIMSPSFNGDRILGAILFEDTMDRKIENKATATYLWEEKGIVPFLKVDKGLEEEKDGVQLMKPMYLTELLAKAKKAGIFGTKMRSLILLANDHGIKKNVDQQFAIAKKICAEGFIPIIEPEVDIKSLDKEEAEAILKICLMESLNKLGPDEKVMLKLTIPTVDNLYMDCIRHPNVVRVFALSGGYSRNEANSHLSRQDGMVASFSRALTEGLKTTLMADEFDTMLDNSIGTIFFASKAGI